MRGRFEDVDSREAAMEEIREDDTESRLVIIPIDCEDGDGEAALEIGV
jgi:hypothetical protein